MFNLIRSFLPLPRLSQRRTLFVASIGNPEPEYAGTRHNVGHMFVNQLVKRWDLYPDKEYYRSRKYPSLVVYKSNDTYMNLQGRFVAKHAARFNGPILIVHDELQVPLGKYQVRAAGTSARGHNGLKSINKHMKNDYTKISIGIDKPEGDVTRHVLSKFTREQQEVLEGVFPKVERELERMLKRDSNM